MTIARHIEPGSVIVEELTETDDNLDVVARVTFGGSADLPPLPTTIHGVFRFDDQGRIALLYATPHDPQAGALPRGRGQPVDLTFDAPAAHAGRGASLHSRSRS